eukprot:s3198_g4.t1
MESSINVSTRARMEQYESMYENERTLTEELKAELKIKDFQLRKAIQDDPSVSDRGPNYAIVEHLESKTEIAQIRAQDLVSEVAEYMEQNLQLKDEMREIPRFGSDLTLSTEVKSLKHALEVERKEKLALGAQQYEKSCQFLGELQDKDVTIKSRDAEINDMRRETAHLKLCLSEHISASSAGIAPNDVRIVTLENEVQAAHLEMGTLRAWNRQLDDAYNEEANVAAQYAAASNQPRTTQIQQTGSNLPPGDGHRSVGDRPSGFTLPAGDGSTRSLRPGGDPPGDDPPDDDGPPGLPSIRSTTVPDDASSFTAATNIEPPRVSRREADKVYVSPWPKHQNLGVWTSDLIKGVCLAANDGDRAAWAAWLHAALQPDPDLDALNDSNGQRYQSIDAKLSIALSNVITQAGDVARHVATKLRLRTQANSRRGTFVMGREILAMILNHFRTPGQRETTFTMEHIVRAQ